MVRYVQLAHNVRHPETGSAVAQVLHSFGREDQLDRDALGRLVGSLSRYLGLPAAPSPAGSGAGGGEGGGLSFRVVEDAGWGEPPRFLHLATAN